MATQKPTPDASSISPYAVAFSDQAGKPLPQQAIYDQESALATRLNTEAGYGPDTSRIMAKQIVDNQRQANALRAQEALLQASREAVSLKSQKNDLTKREKFNQFLSGAMDLDPSAIGHFQDRFQEFEKNHMDVLYNEDPQIARDAQQFLGQKKAAYDNHAAGAVAEAQKYGYGQFPAEAIDTKTGKPDFVALAKIGVPFYNQKLAEEQTRKAKEFGTKLAEETSLAGAKADITAKRYAKQQEIATEEQAKRHPERRIAEIGQSIKVLDSIKSDLLRGIGLPKEEMLFQAKPSDERGRPTKDATHYTFPPMKKGDKPIIVPKDEVDQTIDKIRQINSQRSTMGSSVFSGDVGMMGEGSTSQTNASSGTMVYDPDTGTLKPKE